MDYIYNPNIRTPQSFSRTQTAVQQSAGISPCSIRRILQLTVPIQFAEIAFTDQAGKDITRTSLYSWSSDGLCWTNWVSYPQYLQLAKSVDTDFYLRILIFGSAGVLKIGGLATDCYTICLDNSNQFLLDFCSSPNLFDPYAGLDCALQLQQQLSDTVICMLGIPAYYFKVSPDADTADWTFKEYVLHSVESVKYIKLMCQDGALPSSRPQMTEFDFDWENDWEVEMSKTSFAAAFGDTAFPKQRDMVYVPMMKRMYEVNSAYDEKNEGLMWRSTTWKLALVKYNDKDNVSHGSYEELIDTLVENQYMEILKPVEENEQYRESGAEQTIQPKFAATNLYNVFVSDGIRLEYTPDQIEILDKQVNHGSAVVCRNLYIGKTADSLVSYQKPYCGSDGTILLEISVPSALEIYKFLDLPETGDYPMVYNTLVTAGEIYIGCGVQIEKDTERVQPKTKFSGTAMLVFNDMSVAIEIDPVETKNYILAAKWKQSNFVTEFQVFENLCKTKDAIGRLKPSNWYFDFTRPVEENSNSYNSDYSTSCGVQVHLSPYPVRIGYMKLFNRYLDQKETAVEAAKYSTTTDTCIINDLARPIYGDRGYNVR